MYSYKSDGYQYIMKNHVGFQYRINMTQNTLTTIQDMKQSIDLADDNADDFFAYSRRYAKLPELLNIHLSIPLRP